eukprot:CAMPEP_0178453148 /NCGR_PEP_ID=MMETSP0689_2-20121128/44646_1 /TAXON_ID=160604 /ORGANISM="Amphidinium massartii, Strain CS-259" /LENGTH=92 /DNA_ID=CAMNT_0020078947 /DNA_START=24 /DNA_END=299 /DNA_ORIENTATION=+
MAKAECGASNPDGSKEALPAQAVKQEEAADTASTCRICFSGEGSEKLCMPCPCRGSLQYVHMSCLRSEFLARKEWTNLTCSICKNEFTREAG